MPKIKSHADRLRHIFQYEYGRAIRHLAWIKYVQEIKAAGMEVNEKSVRLLAKFKKQFPRTVMSLDARLKFERFKEEYRNKQQFTGCELLSIIKQYQPNFKSDDCVRKCFYKVGLNFKSWEIYSFQNACIVISIALVHRTREQQK